MPPNLFPIPVSFLRFFPLLLTEVGSLQAGQQPFWNSLSPRRISPLYRQSMWKREFPEKALWASFSLWQITLSLWIDLGNPGCFQISRSQHILQLCTGNGEDRDSGTCWSSFWTSTPQLCLFAPWFLQKSNLERPRSCGALQFYICCWWSGEVNPTVWLSILP